MGAFWSLLPEIIIFTAEACVFSYICKVLFNTVNEYFNEEKTMSTFNFSLNCFFLVSCAFLIKVAVF